MELQEFFALTYRPINMNIPDLHFTYQHLRPMIVCKDGSNMSVQASRTHYCTPRENGIGPYSKVEIWPNIAPPETWAEYYDGEWEQGATGVFGWVPVEMVQEFIDEHGGIDVEKTFSKDNKGAQA